MMETRPVPSPPPSRALSVALWIAQVLLALVFAAGAAMKLAMPIPALAAMIPWAGQVPEAFVRVIGVIDLAGGVGLVLPALTRIKPGLTVLAALGCAVLQLCAIAFHVSRGEAALTPANFVFVAMALFIAWGRRSRAPISPRP